MKVQVFLNHVKPLVACLIFCLLMCGVGTAQSISSISLKPNTVVGGVSVNLGTIPSKTLREAVLDLSGFRSRAFYGASYRVKENITLQDLLVRTNQVIEHGIDIARHQLMRNHVELISAGASFTDPHTLRLDLIDGSTSRTATGSVAEGQVLGPGGGGAKQTASSATSTDAHGHSKDKTTTSDQTVAAETRRVGLDDAERDRHRDTCVHDVAALCQDVGTGLRRERVSRRRDALRRLRHRLHRRLLEQHGVDDVFEAVKISHARGLRARCSGVAVKRT